MAPFEERIHVQVVVAIDFGTTYSGYAISMDADYKIDPLKRLKRNMTLKDDQGRPMRALDVFSASIRYMKGEVWEKLKNAIMKIKESDIHWVLTVPAIWEDGAKQFMRLAANKAGIEDKQLTLALEPEAAAIYCKQIAIQRFEKDDKTILSAFEPGTKFLLLDLGGGTVDSVVELVEENGQLTDIHYPDGGPWGGTLVDEAFKQFLVDIFGNSSVENFSNTYKADELFIYRNFEIKKRNIKPNTSQKSVFRITQSLVECAGGPQAVQHRLQQSKFKDDVELKKGSKLMVDDRVFVTMFSESKVKLIEFIHGLFQEDEISQIDIILLVGGFACSPVIVDAVKSSFKEKQIIVPNEANLAILKGAVLYGRQSLKLLTPLDRTPAVINARHMRYTYGIGTAVPFDDQKHSQTHKRIHFGVPKCDNVFHVFFKAGQRVVPGKTSETCAFNPTANCIEVYRTRSKHPIYVLDEGCFMVGKVILETYDRNGGEIEVAFHAGGTELTVEAKQTGTETPARARFNFLF